MNARAVRPVAATLLGFLALLTGCDNMGHQPAERPLEAPRAMPARAVPQESAPTPPPPRTLALLERGRERYDIFCAPCHGRFGDGQGIIVQRGFPVPPTFHNDRLREATDDHFYDVITHGYGVMYNYANRVAPADRWAVVAYIRALQRSRNGTLADVPADRRARMAGQEGTP